MRSTMPEKATQTLLEMLGFEVKGWRDRDPLDAANTVYSQYPLESMRIDFVLINARIAIEVEGDYWHGERLKRILSLMQVKTKLRDQKKRKRLKELGWSLIRIWECDVMNHSARALNNLDASILANIEV